MDDPTIAHFLADPTDDFKPFDFDDKDGDSVGGFDDKLGGCGIDEQFIPDEDLYDAINDETFGAEMAALTADDDFADFAIRTANLALYDDEPTTSLEPPDPSQIPIPKIGSDQNLQFPDAPKASQKKNASNQNTTFASSQIPPSSSIWASGSFNGIGSLSALYMGHQPKPESSQRGLDDHGHDDIIDCLPNFPYVMGPPPGLVKPLTRSPQQAQTAAALKTIHDGPLSAEELERKLLQEAAAQIAQTKGRNRTMQPPIDSAELERKMMEEAHQRQKHQEDEVQQNQQQQYVIMQQMQQMMQGILGAQQQQMQLAFSPFSSPGVKSSQQLLSTTQIHPFSLPGNATITPPPSLWYQQQQQLMAAMMKDVAAYPNTPMPSNANGQPSMPPMWSPNMPPGMLSSMMPPPQQFNQFYQQWQQHLQQAFAAAAAHDATAGMRSTATPLSGGQQQGIPQHPQMGPQTPFFPPFPPGLPQSQQQPPIHPMAFQHQNVGSANANTSMGGPSTTQMLPPHLMPPTGSGSVCQGQTSTTSTMPIAPNQPPQIAPHLHMVPASLHPQVEKHHRRHKANPALPSGKTIADYALDPYAGLMSTKEREWLIKIHIIQCLGTGDPMEDDFYYASWKQKNVLTKAPEGGSKENPKYYKFEATFPATNYTAPSFMGALGKPVHSSSRIPRQIIEVTNESLEEESLLSGKQTAANRQKRLRAMLIKIENGALMLIDCRDIRRKLHFFEDTCITQYIDKSEITDRVERFDENLVNVEASIFTRDQFSTVMLIQKGRQLVFDWLQFLGSSDETCPKALAFMETLMDGISKFARKIPEESIVAFVDRFLSVCFQIPCPADLLTLVQAIKLERALVADSKLIQLTLLTALYALVRIQTTEIGDSGPSPQTPFSIQQLCGTPIHSLLFDMPIGALKIRPDNDGEDAELFNAIQWECLCQWLHGERRKWGQFVFDDAASNNLVNWIFRQQLKEVKRESKR